MTPRGQGLRRVEAEIVAEKAATLGRAGERLERALLEVHALAARHAAAGSDAERAQLAAAYEAARARAAAARLTLVIQREAVGLRHHRDVDRQFPEPPPLGRRGPAAPP